MDIRCFVLLFTQMAFSVITAVSAAGLSWSIIIRISMSSKTEFNICALLKTGRHAGSFIWNTHPGQNIGCTKILTNDVINETGSVHNVSVHGSIVFIQLTVLITTLHLGTEIVSVPYSCSSIGSSTINWLLLVLPSVVVLDLVLHLATSVVKNEPRKFDD